MDFTYDASWLGWPSALPVSLSLPLREDRYVGTAVIAVFDTLLPDSDAIRRRIATRVRADGTDAFSLLAAIGRDCVGALQFMPAGDETPGPPGVIEAIPMSEAAVAAPVGTTPTTHILKPAIGPLAGGIDFSESVENEYLCMTLMAAFGLPMGFPGALATSVRDGVLGRLSRLDP